MRLVLIVFTLVVTSVVHVLFAELSRILVRQSDSHVTSTTAEFGTPTIMAPGPVFLSWDMMVSERNEASCCATHIGSDDLMAERFGVITDCLDVVSPSFGIVPLYHFLDPMPSLLGSLQSEEESELRLDAKVDWEEKFDHFISHVKENYTTNGNSFVDLLPDLM